MRLQGSALARARRTLLLTFIFCAAPCAVESYAQPAADERSPAARREEAGRGAAAHPDESRGGWVVAAYLGGARTHNSALKISQPGAGNDLTFGGVRFDGRSFDPPLYYGLRGGYFLRRAPSVGLEAEFIHLKVFSDPQQQVRASGQLRGAQINRTQRLGQTVEQYSISHGVNLLLFNVAARHAFAREEAHPAGRLILTARAGLGPTIPHTESNVEGARQEQYELGSAAWQIAGGAEVKLRGGLYVLGEYKFTRTRQRGKIFAGEAESLLRTHHGVFGLNYHF